MNRSTENRRAIQEALEERSRILEKSTELDTIGIPYSEGDVEALLDYEYGTCPPLHDTEGRIA
jgi:hypothetical protein